MRWTASLIRIAEHQIEERRQRLAEIVERRGACEQALIALAEEAAVEADRARGDAEAALLYLGFREGWKRRKADILVRLDTVRLEEEGAREALRLSFEELKKVEVVAENHRIAQRKEEARREGQMLDELARRRVGD